MKPELRGHLAALFTIFVWGITFINTRVLMASFTPVEIIVFRLALAVAALSIASPPHLTRPDGAWLRREWKYAAAGLCGVTGYFLFQNLALAYTLTANVSVLVSTAPLFTALACRVFLQEKLKANFFLGFAVAMAGIILIALNGSLVLKLNPLGDLLSICAALIWAFYSVLIKQISGQQSNMLAVTRKVVTYGLIFLLALLPLFEFRLGAERLVVLPNLLNLIFLGVVASGACYITWNYAIHQLGPVKTSAYIYLVPVVTIFAAVLFLKEPVTLAAGAGMALILAGMALSERERVKKSGTVENGPG